MPNTFNTLEAAQAEIVRLQEENTALVTERDALSQNNVALADELGKVRTLNQQYFNKLTAQYSRHEDESEGEPEPVPTCEEFASTLEI